MAVEAKRGCGYRKVGGLYLVGSGGGIRCDRLPIPLTICPCCSAGIKPTRGWTWVNLELLVGGNHTVASKNVFNETATGPANVPCKCHKACPLCHNVKAIGRSGLLWIGEQFYPTVEAFEKEAASLGVSRRIKTLPKGFEIGKTWILFAHRKGMTTLDPNPPENSTLVPGDAPLVEVPAIFRVWKPEAIERIYVESDRHSEKVAADVKRGIQPVFVPDNDKDHQSKKDEEAADSEQLTIE